MHNLKISSGIFELLACFCKYAKEYFLSLNFWYFPPCARMLDIFLSSFCSTFSPGPDLHWEGAAMEKSNIDGSD